MTTIITAVGDGSGSKFTFYDFAAVLSGQFIGMADASEQRTVVARQ